MSTQPLRSKCHINTNRDADTFVGLKAVDGELSVNFPLGYRVGDSDEEIRKDIILLLSVLAKNTDKKQSEVNENDGLDAIDMPIQAYLYVIYDFNSRGYYKESEIIHKVSKNGKINWNRTIKTQKAFVQDSDIYYLDFVTKARNMNEDELITLIHKYCVYESFLKIGWIYSSYLPERPSIKLNKKLFIGVLRDKLNKTFNDKNRMLFINMINILKSMGEDGTVTNFKCGTDRFEYVWESMIDKAYGIKNKDAYFPKTRWILAGKEHENDYLKPDTIMLYNNKVYVLDAKYYKFGQTGNPSDLPESTSINKQITYGEYIAETDIFKDLEEKNPIVYNAFLMPYNSFDNKFHTEELIHYIGKAQSDWKARDGIKEYEEIIGVLVDVKSLMRNYSTDYAKIKELAELIELKINIRR